VQAMFCALKESKHQVLKLGNSNGKYYILNIIHEILTANYDIQLLHTNAKCTITYINYHNIALISTI